MPFREVRHDEPDDGLYYEPIHVRAKLHEWTIPAHRHEGLHQFQLLVKGSVQARLDGAACTLHAPMALMVPPGVVHGFVYERNSAGHQLTLPSEVLRGYLSHAAGLLERLNDVVLVSAQAMRSGATGGESLFNALASEFQSSQPGRTEALQAWAIQLALWFLRQGSAAVAPLRRQALRDTLLHRYRALLEQHIRLQKPVTFYAAQLGVTADHLSRVCRATSGLSALELLHERLVLEARRLLVYTPAPVVAVARELGFDDPGYFSRFFSKLTGQSPSAYRAAVAQGNGKTPDQSRKGVA